MALTAKQVKAYLDNPHGCPFCGSPFTIYKMQGPRPTLWQDCRCPTCGKAWVEEYLMVNIKETHCNAESGQGR